MPKVMRKSTRKRPVIYFYFFPRYTIRHVHHTPQLRCKYLIYPTRPTPVFLLRRKSYADLSHSCVQAARSSKGTLPSVTGESAPSAVRAQPHDSPIDPPTFSSTCSTFSTDFGRSTLAGAVWTVTPQFRNSPTSLIARSAWYSNSSSLESESAEQSEPRESHSLEISRRGYVK